MLLTLAPGSPARPWRPSGPASPGSPCNHTQHGQRSRLHRAKGDVTATCLTGVAYYVYTQYVINFLVMFKSKYYILDSFINERYIQYNIIHNMTVPFQNQLTLTESPGAPGTPSSPYRRHERASSTTEQESAIRCVCKGNTPHRGIILLAVRSRKPAIFCKRNAYI